MAVFNSFVWAAFPSWVGLSDAIIKGMGLRNVRGLLRSWVRCVWLLRTMQFTLNAGLEAGLIFDSFLVIILVAVFWFSPVYCICVQNTGQLFIGNYYLGRGWFLYRGSLSCKICIFHSVVRSKWKECMTVLSKSNTEKVHFNLIEYIRFLLDSH